MLSEIMKEEWEETVVHLISLALLNPINEVMIDILKKIINIYPYSLPKIQGPLIQMIKSTITHRNPSLLI